MASPNPIEYSDASIEIREIYDEIKLARGIQDVSNFWKYLANDPVTLRRTWTSLKEIMGPGALDSLTKELIYIAVSATNNCAYCIRSHSASASSKGMTDAMFGELMAVVGMANETNKLVHGYQIPLDSP
ncbi:MAG: carboxymuconolactone decarboxylase family protein [Gammaproteobacteria bacterium]|nr:carboxymuconolactone decarboxylase family protein [Gammaproteobacteria bacterium]